MIWFLAGVPVASLLAFLAWRGLVVWQDAGQWGWPADRRLGWALLGAVAPARYWWAARLDALPPQERTALLARETATLGLTRADALACPLCGSEVPAAWTLDGERDATVARGPIDCPACDFRLDACRHCDHFMPGPPRAWGTLVWQTGDVTFGRCSHYHTTQSIDQACAPEMARQLKERGYETIRAPRPIVDSFLPPDSCRAFQPQRRQLRHSGVRWPDARRVALLRLSAATGGGNRRRQRTDEKEELWLL
jgi:hypothetical protein